MTIVYKIYEQGKRRTSLCSKINCMAVF